MKTKVCPVCGREFTPQARGASTDWHEDELIYCSAKCKRSAANRRNYERHREGRLAKARKER